MHLQDWSGSTDDAIRESHLRIAVMLDLITDNWNDDEPVAGLIGDLRQEFARHVAIEESALADIAPQNLDHHRQGHQSMAALLLHLENVYDEGQDIRPVLHDILTLFTQRLMPDDSVFLAN